MALLKIQTGEDNPILRKESVRVTNIDNSMRKFVKDLKQTMLEKDGLGLAAPQVGVNKRVVAVTLNYKTDSEMVVPMINPVILEHGDETAVEEEGCLSLPGQYGKVARWKKIVLEFENLSGEKVVLRLGDLNARVTQHEIDHLDGVLFVDRMKGEDKEENLLL